MRRTGLLLIAGAVVAGVTLCVGAASSGPTPGSSEIEQLKKEVAALRQRVESLEERLKNDLTPASIAERPGVISPYPGLRQVPPNWRRGEFNGLPYYIVPINQTHKLAGEATKPAALKAPDNR